MMWEKNKYKIEEFISSDRWLLISFWLIALFLITIRKDSYHIHLHEIVLSFNNMLLIVFINYVLFPNYYKKGKIVAFITFTIIGIFLSGYFEEGILERYVFDEPKLFEIASPDIVIFKNGFPVFVFIGLKLMIFIKDKQIVIDQLKKEKLESQLQFLKSQINPHILFNNLNNIYSLSIQNDSRTSDTVLKLSNLMRYVIYESSENHVLLEKELGYLNDYLDLQKIQIEGRGEVIFSISGETAGYIIAPLIIIPFVENCFKHSMDTQIDNIHIKLGIEINNGRLTFEGINSYTESEHKNLTPNGVGLKNTVERLKYIYPETHKLEIIKDKNEFRVKLNLELI